MSPGILSTSILVGSGSKRYTELFDRVKKCNAMLRCHRIKLIADVFCSDHRHYTSFAAPILVMKSGALYIIRKITKYHISIGIWPLNNLHQDVYA